MNITIEKKEVYGSIKYYPACDVAKKFASIAKTVTLSIDVLNTIKDLGYKIQLKEQENAFRGV